MYPNYIFVPTGACCLGSGECNELTEEDCEDEGGSYHGDGTTCDDATCNQPPDCSGAAADPQKLWPPNHKFKDILIVGVTDSDGDPVSTVVDAISQDEPTNGLGAGNKCPDGEGVGTDTPKVRSERSGNPNVPGNGRVYHIEFTASDGEGGEGEVTVCVPHDQAPSTVCVDDGPTYDSTDCNGS